jgi:mannonate dehydratase
MLIHSWRWFGPGDRITLEQIVQTGASSIVTSLHEVPAGRVWDPESIRQRNRVIREAGLSWSVVESVPVHEDIKKRTGKYREYTENFKATLINLGKEGIPVVCYNFMPALDWSRTDLKFRFRDGSESLYFNYTHFAAIDIYILKRPGGGRVLRGTGPRFQGKAQEHLPARVPGFR